MMFSFRAIVDVAQRRDEVGWQSLAVPSHQLAPILVSDSVRMTVLTPLLASQLPHVRRSLADWVKAAIGGDPPHKRMHAAR